MIRLVAALLMLHPIPPAHALPDDRSAVRAESRQEAAALVRYVVGAEEARLRATTTARTGSRQREVPNRGSGGDSRPRATGGSGWDAVARCETGGNWSHQTAFDGGLGILHANWVHYGGLRYASYGSQASREQQIAVAERIAASIGFDPGRVSPTCASYHGW